MFPCLRHDTIIGRNCDQGQVYGAHSRHHITDEFLVPGYVNDGDIVRQKSKTEIDGHTPSFLFGKPVCIRPGKCFHQSGFAVVDVSSGTDDYL